jgi:hypothetical protein
MLNSSSISN